MDEEDALKRTSGPAIFSRGRPYSDGSFGNKFSSSQARQRIGVDRFKAEHQPIMKGRV